MHGFLFAAITFILLVTGASRDAAASGRESAFTEKSVDMDFVSVPRGCFQMGDSFGDGEKDEKPVHEVCVDGFSMGKYAVTVGQFRTFVNATGYRTEAEKGEGCLAIDKQGQWSRQPSATWKNPGFSQDDSHPVVCVSWDDAISFNKWLTSKGRTYRLPTEAEWEYAARAGTSSRNFWGNSVDEACKYANVTDRAASKAQFVRLSAHNCDDGFVFTAPVGSYRPNPFGLYDMMGNVWQWTGDWYGESYYSVSPRNNPQGPLSGTRRVSRGGSWRSSSEHVRSSLRVHPPAGPSAGVGFRLASPIQ